MDKKIFDSQLQKVTTKYYLGVLKDEFVNYCLIMKQNDKDFIILQKQMRIEGESKFDEEVSHLQKYFNAELFVEDFVDRRFHPKSELIVTSLQENKSKTNLDWEFSDFYDDWAEIERNRFEHSLQIQRRGRINF